MLQTMSRRLFSAALFVLCTTAAMGQSPETFVQELLADTTYTWRSLSSGGITIHYLKDSFADRHRMMLLRSIEKTVDEVLELLEEPSYDRPLNVFYLDSRDEMKQIIGRPYSGFSYWDADAEFVVVNPEWRSFEKHEFTHMVTMGVWGAPAPGSRWMVEGISVYCDGWCREYSVDEVAYQLLSDGQLPPLQELFDNPADLGEIRAGFYAASLIGFIRNTFGMAVLRGLWLDGTDHLEELTGDDLDTIERAWKDSLKRTVPKDIHVDLETIAAKGCG